MSVTKQNEVLYLDGLLTITYWFSRQNASFFKWKLLQLLQILSVARKSVVNSFKKHNHEEYFYLNGKNGGLEGIKYQFEICLSINGIEM